MITASWGARLRSYLLLLLATFFWSSTSFAQTKVRSNQINVTDAFAWTGQHSFTLPVRAIDIDGSQVTAYTSFGDSFTACAGIVTPANCYVNRIATAKNWTLNNQGVSSTGANDPGQIGLIIPTVTANQGNYSWMPGINDMRNNLTAAQQLDWMQTVEAGLWWLATPDGNKIKASNGAVVYAGSWGTPPSSYGGIMRSATTNGSTATVSNIFGTDIVVMGAWQQSNSSTWSVAIDGIAYPTVTTSTGAYASIAFATTFGPTFVHATGLNEQAHTVVFTCVTASVPNPCYFLAAGTSSGANASNGPWVLAGNVGKLGPTGGGTGYNFPTNPGCPVAPCGSDSLVTQFDEDLRIVVADLAGVGLNVAYVDINAPGFYVPGGSNTQADGVHPTDAGDAFIAAAYTNQAKGYSAPADRAVQSVFSNGNLRFGRSTIRAYNGNFLITPDPAWAGNCATTFTCMIQFNGISNLFPALKFTGGPVKISSRLADDSADAQIQASVYVSSGSAFAALGTPANGTFQYCSDCTIANPCAGGGSGALAKRLNGVWVCN